MHTRRTTQRARLCRAVGTGLTGLVLTIGGVALVAPAAGAQTDTPDQTPSTQAPSDQEGQRRRFPHRAWLTEEQRACLEEQGVKRPPEGQRPTEEQREAFRAAAEACGIELPRRLTDEQRACLEEQGVKRPPEGQRPTEEQREAFRAAAEACGIELPLRRWCPPTAGPGEGQGTPEQPEQQEQPDAPEQPVPDAEGSSV